MVVTEVVLDKVVVHPLVLLSVVDHFSRYVLLLMLLFLLLLLLKLQDGQDR